MSQADFETWRAIDEVERRDLVRMKTLARSWVREATALHKPPATGHSFGRADGLLQAAIDLKKAVDPQSTQTTREWVES